MDNAVVRVRECRYGLMCYFPHDIYIGSGLETYGEYCQHEAELFAALLKPGHVVAEIGANIGSLTVPLAHFVGPQGRVFAFEPQRVLFQQLCANVAMNGLFNVWTEQKAVGWPAAGPTTIGVPPVDYLQRGNFGAVELNPESGQPEMVPLVSLDSLDFNPHFIKIDVEGMELDVINGASEQIRKNRPVIYCENDREDQSAALINAFFARDYDLFWHVTPLFNKENYRGVKEDIWSKPGGVVCSGNMLCIPSEFKIQVNGLRKVKDNTENWKTPQ